MQEEEEVTVVDKNKCYDNYIEICVYHDDDRGYNLHNGFVSCKNIKLWAGQKLQWNHFCVGEIG